MSRVPFKTPVRSAGLSRNPAFRLKAVLQTFKSPKQLALKIVPICSQRISLGPSAVLLIWLSCLLLISNPSVLHAQIPQLDNSQNAQASLTNQPISVAKSRPAFIDIADRYAAIRSGTSGKYSFDIYDLQTGQSVKTLQWDSKLGEPVSISPDLKRALGKPKIGDNIFLLDITNEPRVITKLPFKQSTYGNSTLVSSQQHFFASSDRLILKSAKGLTGFSIYAAQNGKFIGQFKQPARKSNFGPSAHIPNMPGNQARVTSDGKFVFAQIEVKPEAANHGAKNIPGNVLRFMNLSNGQISGQLELDANDNECFGARLSPDSQRIVSFSDGKTFRYVSGFAANGKRQFKIPFPNSRDFGPIRWLGNDHFLVGNILASFSKQKILASLEDFKPKQVIESTGQAIFMGYHDRQYYLTVENVFEDLGEAFQTGNSKVNNKLKPGDAISVVYEMPDDEPISGFEEKFEFAIYQSLTNAGYKLRKDAKVKLEIVVDELSTGEVIAISSGIESDLPKHMGHMQIDRFKETERFNVPKVKLKCNWSLQDASGKAFHKDDFSIGFPPNSELKFTDRDGLITFARQWQWKKLLENMNQQFDSEYHQFDLLVATFDSGPGQTHLAEAKKMRSEKSLAEHAAKRAVANEARDRERKARDLINARRDFLRAKSDRDTLVLKESSSHAAWKFTASQLEDMDVRAGQTIQVASKDDFGADEIRFATINTAQVAVLNRERKSRARRVDRFDLKKEKRLASTPVEKYSKLLDVRPDGKVWMVTKDRDKKVVQVYQATSGASDKLAAELDLSAGGSIENAWFTGRKTMLTWTGKICAGYQLPSGKQVFELEAGESTISARDFQPVLSSDRQYFIHKGREGLEVRKSSDGSLAGELKTFVLPSRITAMALLNDSKRLAVLTEKAVEIFDMQSGQPLQQICIEKLRGQMEWLQEDLILVGHQAISLKTGAIVWQYGSRFKPPFLKPAPGVGWVASQSDKAITRANVPTATELKKIRTFEKDPPTLLAAGDEVEIVVEGQDDWQTLKKSLVPALKTALQDAGYRVVDKSEAKVVVKVRRRSPYTLSHARKIAIENEGGEEFILSPNHIYSADVSITKDGSTQTLRTIEFNKSAMKFEVDWSTEDPASEFEQNWESEMVRRITAAPFPETITDGTSHIQGKTAFDRR